MRRILGFIAIAAGVFLVVAAPLVKWYLAPRAARVPLDQHAVISSVSDGRSLVLDKGTLTIRTGLTLDNRQVVQGDGPAGNGTVAVWESLSRLQDADHGLISASKERVALDRVSAMAVDCCNQQLDGVPVRYEGLTFKFPFDTRRRDYPFFDADTRRAWPMTYQGEEKAFGLTLYRFSQVVPATDVETLDAPLSLLGRPGQGSTTVHRYYENVTDVLVEPTSGVIVRGGSHQIQTLRDDAGHPLVTVADINAVYTEATQRYFADTAADVINQLRLVRIVVPIIALILGIALLTVGLILIGVIGARRAAPGPDRAVNESIGERV